MTYEKNKPRCFLWICEKYSSEGLLLWKIPVRIVKTWIVLAQEAMHPVATFKLLVIIGKYTLELKQAVFDKS
jgi:hypothetical protein